MSYPIQIIHVEINCSFLNVSFRLLLQQNELCPIELKRNFESRIENPQTLFIIYAYMLMDKCEFKWVI